MDLVGYIYVAGRSSGVGTSCSNIPTAHYAHSLSTMTQRCWVETGLRDDHVLWYLAPWDVGVVEKQDGSGARS